MLHLDLPENDNYTLMENVSSIFSAPGGKAVVVDEKNIQLYDPLSKKSLLKIENEIGKIKQVIWSTNFVAVMSAQKLTILTK